MMKKIYLLTYYLFAQYLPMQPIPGYKFYYTIRRWLVRRILQRCGQDVVVKSRCYFGNGSRLVVGARSQLGLNSRLNGTISIGEDVLMGPDVIIMATTHNFSSVDIPINQQGSQVEHKVCIGNNVWLGTRSIVLPGVTIGDHSIVGAGAVVTKSFPPYSILAGVPAKLVRSRLPSD